MKRLFCCLLVLTMLLSALPAMADNVRKSGLYTYEIKGNGTITITAFDWSKNDGDIFIPNMIDGYTVTAIGDEAFRCNSVRRIGHHSKYKNNNFDAVSLTLPDGIKSIGEKAFWNATLSEINLPNSIQYIGYGAFVGNPTLSFKLSNSHPYFAVIDGALYNKSSKELLAYPYFNEKYEQYRNDTCVIPEGILSIGDYAFYRDIDAELAASYAGDYYVDGIGITFASTIQRIGDYAFYGFRFNSITNGCTTALTTIDQSAFENPTGNLITNGFPTALTTIGQSAFENATGNLHDALVIPTSVSIIKDAAFRNSNIMFAYGSDNYILIPTDSSLREIGNDVFRECQNPIVVEAENIRSVGDYAFFNVKALTWLHLDSIDTFGNYVWDTNTASCLDDRTLWRSGISEFSLSPQLRVIPAGFNLAWIVLPDTVTTISENAFTIEVTNFYLPKGLTYIDIGAFKKGSTFIVEAGSYAELWCSENGFGYSIEGQEDDLSWLN